MVAVIVTDPSEIPAARLLCDTVATAESFVDQTMTGR